MQTLWCIVSFLLFGVFITAILLYYNLKKGCGCKKGKENYVTFPSGRMNSPNPQTREGAFRGYSDCLTMCSSIHPDGVADGKVMRIDTMGRINYDCIDKCEEIMKPWMQ
jgi:hypothetical protein